MSFSRAIPFALVFMVLPLGSVQAQFGGMPGMPGSPAGPGFGAAPQQPPPACQQLIVLRDETAKHGQALQSATKKGTKPSPDEVCKLFKAFLGSEAKMIKGLEQNSSTCGVPPEVIKQLKSQHAQAGQTGKQVCDAATRGPPTAGPSFSDALGTTPLVPDSAEQNKQRGGAFDTLTGNALQR
jgi:hypothetical protein